MRRFGMEWEVDIDRQVALDVVADIVACPVEGPRLFRPNRDGSRFMSWRVGGWQVGGDPSLLRDRIPVARCTEISTAPLTTDATWPLVLDALAHAGARVTSRCALQVHVEAKDATPGQLVEICRRERQHLALHGIVVPPRRAMYARPVPREVLELPDDVSVEDLARAWYGGPAPSPAPHRHPSRRREVNLHSWWYRGTVEFRWPSMVLEVGAVRDVLDHCRDSVEQVLG